MSTVTICHTCGTIHVDAVYETADLLAVLEKQPRAFFTVKQKVIPRQPNCACGTPVEK